MKKKKKKKGEWGTRHLFNTVSNFFQCAVYLFTYLFFNFSVSLFYNTHIARYIYCFPLIGFH